MDAIAQVELLDHHWKNVSTIDFILAQFFAVLLTRAAERTGRPSRSKI